MTDHTNNNPASLFGAEFDRLDVVSIERQAREMRAKLIGDALRSVARWIAGRVRSLRGVGSVTARAA